MAQNYNYPAGFASSVNPSVGIVNTAAPADATEVGGVDPSNKLQPLQLDASKNLLVSIAAQALSPMITSDLADGPVSPGAVASKSMLLGIQYNAVLPTLADTQQASLQGDSSGRLILSPLAQLPAALGQQLMAASLSVAIASDQSAIPVSQSGTWNINNISGTVSLPTGASTSALQSQISGQLPATLGQKAMAASLAVAISSDQSAIPASQSGAWTVAATQSGTWDINNISGTVSLPTGASTAANQTAVQGSASGGTAAANSQLAGAIYNAALPTLTTGQQASLQLDASGRLIQAPLDNSSVVKAQLQDNAGNGITSTSNALDVNIKSPTTLSVNQVTPTAGTISQAAISVGTTAVRLTASGSAPSSSRTVLVATPDSASVAKFYIGSSSVTNSGATRGIEIAAGQTFTANNDANDYYIISDTAAQTVFVMEVA